MFLEKRKISVMRKNRHYWTFTAHLESFFSRSFKNLKFMIWNSSELIIFSLNFIIQNGQLGIFQKLEGRNDVNCGRNGAPLDLKIGSELFEVFFADFDEGVFSNFGDDFFSKKLFNVPNFAGLKVKEKIIVFLMQKVLLLNRQDKVFVIILFSETNFKKRLNLLSMHLF